MFGIGYGYGITRNRRATSDIPGDTPVYHLDGTILGSELVDIINGYNFTITNKDFDSDTYGGIPFKSIATISAPGSGDAKTAVLAIDVNNFWYDSGGNPNNVPLSAFFQNVDFVNRLFCRHTDRVIDENEEEITPPMITDIVGYSTVQTIDSEFTDFYGTDIDVSLITKALWVAKDGNDSTGDGSFENPFLTIDKCEPMLDNGAVYNRVMIKTGIYNEASPTYGFLYIRETSGTKFWFHGTGNVKAISSSGLYVWQFFSHEVDIKHICFDGTNSTSTSLYQQGTVEAIVNKCTFINGATNHLSLSSPSDIRNCGFDNTAIVFAKNEFIGNSSHAVQIVSVNGSTNNITYNKFLDNTAAYTLLMSGVTSVVSYFIKHNTFRARNTLLRGNLSNCTALEIEWNKFYDTADSVFPTLLVLASGATTGDKCIPKIQYNEFHADNAGGIAISVSAAGLNDPIIRYNYIHNSFVDASYRGISVSTALNSGACNVSYNRIFIDSPAGYGIDFGETGGDFFTGTQVIGNLIRGHLYNYPENTNQSLHGIANARGTDFTVAYNRISYCPLGFTVKGGATAYTSGGVYGNVIFECEAGFYVRQTDGVKLYNNTFANYDVVCGRFGAFDDEDGNISDNVVVENNIFHSVLHAAGNGMFYAQSTVLTRSGILLDNNIYNPPVTMTKFLYDEATNDYTYAESVTNGWAANGTVETVSFNDLANGNLSLASGSNGIGDGSTLDAAYDDGLDVATDWGDEDELPIIVTKQQTVPWDKGAYVFE